MFDQIIGHERTKKQLAGDITSRHFHQSYLFSGPEHIGKMSLLQEFISQARFSRPFDPTSPLAGHLKAGQGPGLISFMDDGESLKVEEIRKMIDFVSRRTGEGELSFCVIEHVERMTRAAANAFLKILEEPSPRFVYMMTTREEKKLLPTVLSRVQLYRCGTVPAHTVEIFLRGRVGNALMTQELMKLSGGRVGLALNMLTDESCLEKMRKLYDLATVLFEDDLVDRFTLAEHLTKEDYSDADLSQFLSYVAARLHHDGVARSLPQLERLQRLKRLFQDTQVNKRLWLEELFLSL